MRATPTRISLFIVLLAYLHESHGGATLTKPTWSYDDTQGWVLSSGNQDCMGPLQSPINLDTSNLTYHKIEPIQFVHYSDKIDGLTVQNYFGHTVIANVQSQKPPIGIEGGNFLDWYQLVQFHFHWGKDATEGSEHLLNSKHFPLELHLVHTKNGQDPNVLVDPDTYAVLSVFFEISDTPNPELDKLTDVFSEIPYAGDEIHLHEPFQVSNLLPGKTFPFYRYWGSLTTPPCSQKVSWTVFEHYSYLSAAQLSKFHQLYEETRADAVSKNVSLHHIDRTYRMVQPLNHREIYHSEGGDELLLSTGGAGHVQWYHSLLILPFAVLMWI